MKKLDSILKYISSLFIQRLFYTSFTEQNDLPLLVSMQKSPKTSLKG
jgi:hypothetical protein